MTRRDQGKFPTAIATARTLAISTPKQGHFRAQNWRSVNPIANKDSPAATRARNDNSGEASPFNAVTRWKTG
jgi:hypothetical protein